MLTVESGQAGSDSESYASVADADSYHDLRGNTNWATMSTAEKEASLRRGTDYMVQVYRLRWEGLRLNDTQALDWPRNYVRRNDTDYTSGAYYYYANDVVPVEVKNACIELAFKAASGELAADLTQVVVREKVDVLEIEYDKYSPQYPRYRAIDLLLQPFFKVNGNGINRAVVRV